MDRSNLASQLVSRPRVTCPMPANRYSDFALDERARVAGSRADDLQVKKVPSAAERKELVEDTVDPLLAVHPRLGRLLSVHTPKAPAK